MERIDLSAQYAPIELALHSCRYLPAKDMVAGKKVLDIACGEGVGAALLLEWGAAEVVGVDLSQAAITQAENTFGDNPRARFVCADAFEFLTEHGQEFDIIISVETIEHLPDPEAFLKKLAEQRRADATVIISCPNDYFYYGRGTSLNPYHMTQFSFYDFRSMAERHLGEAAWYLGAPNSGFSAVALDAAKPSAKDYTAALKKVKPSVSAMVPASILERDKLKPSTALFYQGVWSSEPLSVMYQCAFPATSHFRLPRIINVSDDISIGRTHRVAFVIDQHEWAFDNIVKNMEPYLAGRYQFSFFYISDYANKADLLHDVFVANSYDNVHFMWREFLFFALSHERIMMDLLEKSGLDIPQLAAKIAAPALTTSVYDHLFLREEDVEERQDSFALVDAYATSSLHLHKAYNASYHKKPHIEISDGVNLDVFAPARAAQSQREVLGDQVIQIGWVGNSTWGTGNDSMVEDAKGLHSILVPAIERLALEGYPVTLALADRNIRKRDRAEMVTYYGEIDILVCSSAAEGTPNPILEAMASGIPFVSTDVGIVREAAGPLQSEFIIKQRNVVNMYRLLKKLLDEPETRTAIAAENVSSIENWNWGAKTPRWLRLFAAGEAAHEQHGRKLREVTFTARLLQWQQKSVEIDLKKQIAKMRQKSQEEVARLSASNTKLKTAQETAKEQLRKTTDRVAVKDANGQKLKEAHDDLRQTLLERDAEVKRLEGDVVALRARIPITRARVMNGIKSRIFKKRT